MSGGIAWHGFAAPLDTTTLYISDRNTIDVCNISLVMTYILTTTIYFE